MPAAAPEASGMEQYWNKSRMDVPVSEYSFEEMRHRLSEYLKASSIQLDVRGFIRGGSILFTNL